MSHFLLVKQVKDKNYNNSPAKFFRSRLKLRCTAIILTAFYCMIIFSCLLFSGITNANAGNKFRIPVFHSHNGVFDCTKQSSSKFGIQKPDSPENTIILNIPHSFYADHGEKVWTALAVMAILIMIIIILGSNIKARRKTEAELKKYRDHLEDLVKNRTDELEKKQTLFKMAQKLGCLEPWYFDTLKNERVWAEKPCKIFENPLETSPAFGTFINCVHPDDRKYVDTQWQSALNGGLYDVKYRLLIHGKVKWIREKAELKFNKKGICIGGIGFIQDINDLKLSELLLKENEKRYQALSNSSFEAVLISKNGYCADANLTASKMFGYTHEEFIGMLGTSLIAPKFREIVNKNMLSGDEKSYEAICQKKDGTRFYTEIHCRNIKYRDRMMRVTVIHDINKRKKAEKHIIASLKEKKVLLKEIHHRVKNNMQVISSLLKLQALNTDDPKLTGLLMDCQQRVHAMSFAHEILYSSYKFTAVNLKSYIFRLTDQLYRFYNLMGRVKLIINTENISIDIDQASALGLIINELVSNSMKYAFPGKNSGEIFIGFHRMKKDMSELIVSDNGIGISKDLDWRNSDSLGFQLIVLLAENQLDGSIGLNRNDGTRFTVIFRLKKINKRNY